jgi:hypothetical protein
MSEQSPGMIPGDILLVVKQKPHKTCKRQGNDLKMDVEITLKEALLGSSNQMLGSSNQMACTTDAGPSAFWAAGGAQRASSAAPLSSGGRSPNAGTCVGKGQAGKRVSGILAGACGGSTKLR